MKVWQKKLFTLCMSHFQVLASFIQLYNMSHSSYASFIQLCYAKQQRCLLLDNDAKQRYLYIVFLFNFTDDVSKEIDTLTKR